MDFLPDMPLPVAVRTLIRRLNSAGYEAYVVGGSVRDCLRGQIPHDYDLTTSATPDEMKRVFSDLSVIETGIRHGTLTVLSDGEPYEITTYRLDGTYADHRHPDGVSFTRSLTEDLARRDFTMNAVAYHPDTGFVDSFGGIADIAARRIRSVGDPHRRFEEDALRILRALRFSSVLGFEIEENTTRAALDRSCLLKRVSNERVRDELCKLLTGDAAAVVLHAYPTVIDTVLPELTPMRGCPQHTPYHCHDVWEHTLGVISALPREPLLRLAGLLHDVGKPDCRVTDANGTDHFKGHAVRGAEIAAAICRRLRFDHAFSAELESLVLHHNDRTPPCRADVLRLLAALGYPRFCHLEPLVYADIAAHAPHYEGTHAAMETAHRTFALGHALQQAGECYSVSGLAVGGADILSATDCRGPAVGKMLTRLLDAVMDGTVKNVREQLLVYLKTVAQSGEKKL